MFSKPVTNRIRTQQIDKNKLKLNSFKIEIALTILTIESNSENIKH